MGPFLYKAAVLKASFLEVNSKIKTRKGSSNIKPLLTF